MKGKVIIFALCFCVGTSMAMEEITSMEEMGDTALSVLTAESDPAELGVGLNKRLGFKIDQATDVLMRLKEDGQGKYDELVGEILKQSRKRGGNGSTKKLLKLIAQGQNMQAAYLQKQNDILQQQLTASVEAAATSASIGERSLINAKRYTKFYIGIGGVATSATAISVLFNILQATGAI